MKYTIVTYCSLNYQDCLSAFIKYWVADEIIVFTDGHALAVPDGIMKEVIAKPSDDWHDNTERKIHAIKRGLEISQNDNVVFVDADCLITGELGNAFIGEFDIRPTRMVHRKDKRGEKEINSGVIFFRKSPKTISFCDRWLKLAREYYEILELRKYHEQTSFSHLCYEGFDGLLDINIVPVSERIYNMENDNRDTLLEWVLKYKPLVVHFKSGIWKDNEFVKIIKKCYNIK